MVFQDEDVQEFYEEDEAYDIVATYLCAAHDELMEAYAHVYAVTTPDPGHRGRGGKRGGRGRGGKRGGKRGRGGRHGKGQGQYQQLRKALQNQKTERGFGTGLKKMSLVEIQGKTRCHKCQQIGHWSYQCPQRDQHPAPGRAGTGATPAAPSAPGAPARRFGAAAVSQIAASSTGPDPEAFFIVGSDDPIDPQDPNSSFGWPYKKCQMCMSELESSEEPVEPSGVT